MNDIDFLRREAQFATASACEMDNRYKTIGVTTICPCGSCGRGVKASIGCPDCRRRLASLLHELADAKALADEGSKT